METTKTPGLLPVIIKLAGKALGKVPGMSVCPGELFDCCSPLALETVTALGLQAPGNFAMVAVTHVRPSILLLGAVDDLDSCG